MASLQKNNGLRIYDWFLTSAGKTFLQNELSALSHLPMQFFGHYLLQIGGTSNINRNHFSNIKKHIFLHPDFRYVTKINNHESISADPEFLPLQPASIDTTLLLHVLEFSKNPDKILNEISSVLVPEGYLIIFGFNPYSLLGLRRFFCGQKSAFEGMHYLTPGRLKKCLGQLGLVVEHYQTLFFRPPFNEKRKSQKFLFLEWLGQVFFPLFGSVYLIVAQKKEVALTLRKENLLRKFVAVPHDSYAGSRASRALVDE